MVSRIGYIETLPLQSVDNALVVTSSPSKNANGASARQTVTIANGAAVSSALNISAIAPRGLGVVGAATWTAADIAFEVSTDGSTWIPVYKNDARLKITGVSASEARLYSTPAEVWVIGAFEFLRLTSISTVDGTNTNQGGARTLTVVFLS